VTDARATAASQARPTVMEFGRCLSRRQATSAWHRANGIIATLSASPATPASWRQNRHRDTQAVVRVLRVGPGRRPSHGNDIMPVVPLSASARRHEDTVGPASWRRCLPRPGVMAPLSASAGLGTPPPPILRAPAAPRRARRRLRWARGKPLATADDCLGSLRPLSRLRCPHQVSSLRCAPLDSGLHRRRYRVPLPLRVGPAGALDGPGGSRWQLGRWGTWPGARPPTRYSRQHWSCPHFPNPFVVCPRGNVCSCD
jgi:hypothetical protein